MQISENLHSEFNRQREKGECGVIPGIREKNVPLSDNPMQGKKKPAGGEETPQNRNRAIMTNITPISGQMIRITTREAWDGQVALSHKEKTPAKSKSRQSLKLGLGSSAP